MLNTGQIEKARGLIKTYIGNDRNAWVHWLSKIMNKRLINQFIDLIPMEPIDQRKPGALQTSILPHSFYNKMYLHLIK